MAMRRAPKLCWYRRRESVVKNTSKPSRSAESSNSPFVRFDQPRSCAVEMSCRWNSSRRGAGVPWSNRIRTQAGASALRAACSSTARTWSSITPGNDSTN